MTICQKRIILLPSDKVKDVPSLGIMYVEVCVTCSSINITSSVQHYCSCTESDQGWSWTSFSSNDNVFIFWRLPITYLFSNNQPIHLNANLVAWQLCSFTEPCHCRWCDVLLATHCNEPMKNTSSVKAKLTAIGATILKGTMTLRPTVQPSMYLSHSMTW